MGGGSGGWLQALSSLGSAVFGGGMTTLNPIGEVSASQIPISFPGRASGGPVTAGTTYMVGEQGPELFKPHSSGTIVPNGASDNAAPQRVQIDVNLSPMLIAAIVDQSASRAEARVMARVRNSGGR